MESCPIMFHLITIFVLWLELGENITLKISIWFSSNFYWITILLPLIQIRIVILDPVFDINSNSKLNWNSVVILNSILNCAQAWFNQSKRYDSWVEANDSDFSFIKISIYLDTKKLAHQCFSSLVTDTVQVNFH